MNVFVVNLERRPDRRERMVRLLPPGWWIEYTTHWPGPLDGAKIDMEHLEGFELFPWKMSSDNPWWNRPLKLGEIGCAVSHWSCWKAARSANADRALILEDDVTLVSDFHRALPSRLADLSALDPNWDLVYLGRWKLEPDRPAAPGIVRPGYSYCSFGYLLSASGLSKVTSVDFEHALIPVDEFLPAMYMDHPREDVRARFPRLLNAYAFDPPLVGQLPKDQAGSDTEASEFVAMSEPTAR